MGMRSPSNPIDFTIQHTGLSIPQIAHRLKLSGNLLKRVQSGEASPPWALLLQLRELTGIGAMDENLVLMAGSVADARKWVNLIRNLAVRAAAADSTGFVHSLLENENGGDGDMLFWFTFDVLERMGVPFPQPFPDGCVPADAGDAPSTVPGLIAALLKAATALHAYHLAFVDPIFQEVEPPGSLAFDIYDQLLALAATKLPLEESPLTPNFQSFKAETEHYVRGLLEQVLDVATQAHIRPPENIMRLVTDSPGSLNRTAEAEGLRIAWQPPSKAGRPRCNGHGR